MPIEIISGQVSPTTGKFEKLTVGTNKAINTALYSGSSPLVQTNNSELPSSLQGVVAMGNDGIVIPVLRSDTVGSLRTGDETLLFFDPVEGSAYNPLLWTQSLSGMTMTQASGVITFNNAASTTSTNYAILQSNKNFFLMPRSPILFSCRAIVVPSGDANATVDIGFGTPSTSTADIGNGACFRFTNNGLTVKIYSNSVAVATTAGLTVPNTTDYYTYQMIMGPDFVRYCIRTTTGTPIADGYLAIPATVSRINASSTNSHIPAFARVINTGAAGVAPKIFLGQSQVQIIDFGGMCKPWPHQLAGFGRHCSVDPVAFTQTANYANSTDATNAVASNTAAAYSTLGGQFLTSTGPGTGMYASGETDYILFAGQVPSPYTLYITGIRISCINVGAAVSATVPNTIQWILGVDSNNADLTVGGTYPSMRVTLGQLSCPINGIVGQQYTSGSASPNVNQLVREFDTPLVCGPGRYVHVIFKVLSSAGTASQFLEGIVGFDGYYE